MTEERSRKTAKKEKAAKAPQNTEVNEKAVFIGNKPVMNYVLACLTHLNSGSNKVTIKARGRAIPRAVDTVEVLRRSFAKGLQLDTINLGTEEVPRAEGRTSKVSAIEITVTKP